MSFTSRMSSVNWTKLERKWFGYGIGKHYKAERKAFSRSRRSDGRQTCQRELQDWYDMVYHKSEAETFEEWIMALTTDNVSSCGSMWINEDMIELYRDDISIAAYTHAKDMIKTYKDMIEKDWFLADLYDDDFYDDVFYDSTDPCQSISRAFDIMEDMNMSKEAIEYDDMMNDDDMTEDELEYLSTTDSSEHCSVFGDPIFTDETLMDWHTRKVG